MRTLLQSSQMRILFLLVAIVGLAGCQPETTYQRSYKTLSMSKGTVEALYQTVKQMHSNGQIDDVKFERAGEAYDAARKVQGQFIEAQIVAMRNGTKTNAEQAATLGIAYMSAVSQFITMAIEYKAIKADDPSILSK